MTFHFRPAKREHTPLIIGLAGPTKSGKTYSAHRLAIGLANGGPVAMINAEGAKGHQYSDKFDYLAADITAPYRPERYTEVLKTALALEPRPAVVIIDSGSHMHDGPGGILEYHEDELDRLAGDDYGKRQRSTYSAWIKPKAAENEFIYTMLGADCHIILCLRAKEKIKVVTGKPPIDLGWQPIVGERVAFETIFTLTLPPHSKGVPDLEMSEMREPFDRLIPPGQPLSEDTGRALAAWAAGAQSSGPGPQAGHGRPSAPVSAATPTTGGQPSGPDLTGEEFIRRCTEAGFSPDYVKAATAELFPGKARLTGQERALLLAAMTATPPEAAADAAAETRAPGGGDGQQVEEPGDLRGSPAVGAEPTGNPGSAPGSSAPDTGEDPEPGFDVLVEAAGALIIPDGNHKGQPINAVTDPTWIKWALRQSKYHKPVDEFPAIHDALETWVRAKKPELAMWYQAWLDAGSPVGPAFENWSKERRAEAVAS